MTQSHKTPKVEPLIISPSAIPQTSQADSTKNSPGIIEAVGKSAYESHPLITGAVNLTVGAVFFSVSLALFLIFARVAWHNFKEFCQPIGAFSVLGVALGDNPEKELTTLKESHEALEKLATKLDSETVAEFVRIAQELEKLDSRIIDLEQGG